MLIEHYTAARNQAAVVRLDGLGILKLTGPERQSWLQGMVTNEVGKLTAGQGCYAGHLNAQGKLIAQMIVLVTEDEVWLLVERVVAAKVAAVFDRLIIMEDVQVRDVSDDYEILGVVGPLAGKVVQAWTGNVPPDNLYRHQSLAEGRLLSWDLGYGVLVLREGSENALKGITAAGAVPIDMETWNVLRTEAGLPVYGIDIDETTTLPELGPRGISYDKGCYIGQEVVAKIKYLGHVNRRFVGLVCEGPVIPETRAAVQWNGKDVGYVTTAVFSPGVGKPIALGFVNRVVAEPGTAVVLAGTGTPAKVVSLPFI